MKKIKLFAIPALCLSFMIAGCKDDPKKSKKNEDPETSETSSEPVASSSSTSSEDDWSFWVG